MLEWRKEILKKNRYNQIEFCDQSNFTDDNHLFVYIDQMKSHFLKLFSYLIRTKTANEEQGWVLSANALQPPELNIPINISDKEQLKLMILLYRRLKSILANFQYQFNLDEDFEEIYNQTKNSEIPSISSFFGLCCYRIIEQINEINIKKQKAKNNVVDEIIVEKIKKQTHKEISDTACQTIYKILELQRIQASYIFIQGLDLNHNVEFVYERQKSKNKKSKKQYNQYIIKYENRNKQKEDRKKLASVIVKKNYSGETFWKNQPLVKGSCNLSIKVEKIVSRSESESKVLKGNISVQKQRVKLEPLTRNRLKLKLGK